MRTPFPGMDPYLEHPALWPDVHNRLIAAIADSLAPALRPRYYIGLERRTYLLMPDELVFIGLPDISVISRTPSRDTQVRPAARPSVLEVDVPMRDEVGENFLEIHEVSTGKIVTILELLSPANKLHDKGRETYEEKRDSVFRSRTNLVEVDLLRAGDPMPILKMSTESDYRILVARGSQRPKAQLYAFGLRGPIPQFPLPLLPDDREPAVDLNDILHSLYERAGYDLRLDYSRPPVPPLGEGDAAWAKGLIEARREV